MSEDLTEESLERLVRDIAKDGPMKLRTPTHAIYKIEDDGSRTWLGLADEEWFRKRAIKRGE